MKFSLPLVLLSAFAATTKADTVQVSDFLVDKHEDAITRAVKVRSVSFTLDGYEASSVNCAASPPPTFPSDILKCDDPNYRFVITEGEEGSGLQFAVQVYYDNQATGVHIQGLESVVTRCYPKTDVSEEFRYECTQVLPVSVPLECTFRC